VYLARAPSSSEPIQLAQLDYAGGCLARSLGGSAKKAEGSALLIAGTEPSSPFFVMVY
jgi:hypothetical protein